MSEFDHDRPDPTRPEDWEYTTVTPEGATILISKVGGGTIGQRYTGTWHYSYTYRDFHQTGSDMTTGIPKTHAEVAHEFVEGLDS